MHVKVICAVYGPHAQTGKDTAFSEEGQLQCEFSYAPFAMPGGRRESRGGKKDDERELSTLLRQTLESSVQVSSYCLDVTFRCVHGFLCTRASVRPRAIDFPRKLQRSVVTIRAPRGTSIYL